MVPDDEDDLEKTNVTHSGELVRELLAKSQRDRAYLIVLQGSNVGEMYRLDGGESVIGRASTAGAKANAAALKARPAARPAKIRREVMARMSPRAQKS